MPKEKSFAQHISQMSVRHATIGIESNEVYALYRSDFLGWFWNTFAIHCFVQISFKRVKGVTCQSYLTPIIKSRSTFLAITQLGKSGKKGVQFQPCFKSIFFKDSSSLFKKDTGSEVV